VPVIWSANNRSINIFHLDYITIVFELLWTGADLFRCKVQVRLINVTDADDLAVFMKKECIQNLIAAIAKRDKSKSNTVIGSDHSHIAQGSRKSACNSGFCKISARQFAHNETSDDARQALWLAKN
jgi:hypothetical protein